MKTSNVNSLTTTAMLTAYLAMLLLGTTHVQATYTAGRQANGGLLPPTGNEPPRVTDLNNMHKLANIVKVIAAESRLRQLSHKVPPTMLGSGSSSLKRNAGLLDIILGMPDLYSTGRK